MIYLDCSSGVAGDMFAAALTDLGADCDKIKKTLSPIAKVGFSRVKKGKVRALKFNVRFSPNSREFTDLIGDIRRLRLKPKVEKLAQRILRILAEAESEVHGVPLNKVHLHEAVDCVVDAVGAAAALDELGLIDEPMASSVVGCGFIAPATQRILTQYGIPVKFISKKELVTPTGAAILAALVSDFRQMEYCDAGIGAGSMNLPWPNVLKAALVSPKVVLESNVDDCTPEHISHMMETLMAAGALDVHTMPCVMKKGRIGFLVRVLTDRPREHADIVMAETRTLGVRVMPVDYRFEMARDAKTVKVRFGLKNEVIRVKYSPLGYKPEFDDVSKAAAKHHLTFRQAMEMVRLSVEGADN
jgi:pyridinium-3,5-bisthiocarboxylic acid mononucleotide nickel chelatase